MRSIILALAILAPLVMLVPGAFPVVDDGPNSWRMYLVERENESFVSQLNAAVFDAAYGGHYRPTQDAIFAVAWQLGGPNGWTRLILGLYVLMHVISALLLVAILRSLGAGPGAWIAALAFGIHPVASDVMVCAQYAHNVLGVFWTLLACWAVCGNSRPRSQGLLAAMFVFLAAGSNPNWLISAPCAVALVAALQRGLPARGWKSWWVIVAFTAVAILAAAWLRLEACGALRTPHPSYSGPRTIPPLASQASRAAEGVFALEPAVSPVITAVNPYTLDPGSGALWVAVLVGILAPVILLARGEPSSASPGRPWRALVAAFGFSVIALAPYFTLVGYHGQHRYLYAALPGLIASAVLLVEALARRVAPRTWTRALLVVLVAPALFFVARANLDAIASIRAAHRHAHAVISGLCDHVRESPEILRVQMLGRVLSVGRSGIVYPGAHYLQGQLGATLQRPRFRVVSPTALEDIASGGGEGVGVFRASASGEVRRVPSPGQISYEDLCVDFLLRWRRFWRDRDDHPIATIPSAELAGTFVTILAQRMGPRQAHLYCRNHLEVRRGTPTPAILGVGMLVPSTLSKAIHAIAEDPRAASLICRWIPASDGALPVVDAALAVAEQVPRRDSLRILTSVAMARTDARDRARAIADRRFPSLDHARFAKAIDAEIAARELLSRGEARAARRKFVEATHDYKALGIPRMETWLGQLRCDLLSGRPARDMERPFSTWAQRGVPLAEEAGWAAGVNRAPSGLQLEIVRPIEEPASREQVELVVCITNASEEHIPGGEAPYSALLEWEWSVEGRDERLPGNQRRLPDHGVPAGGQIRLPCLITAPGIATALTLEAVLEVGDQTFRCEHRVAFP